MKLSEAIPLTQGKVAIVDTDDAAIVRPYRWSAVFRFKNWYARANVWIDGRRTTIYMHQLILPKRQGLLTDHENGNGLDNRRANLRYATRSQNRANQHRSSASSGVKGVYWHSRDQVWQALIGKTFLGYFTNKQEAIAAYQQAATARFGEFACQK